MMGELTNWDIVAIAARVIAYTSCFASAGSIIFLLANPKLPDDLVPALKRLTASAAFIALAASVAQLCIQAGRLLDEGLAGMLDREMLELVAGTPLGSSILVRIVGLVTAIAFVADIPAKGLFGVISAVVITTSFSFVGHGTHEPRWVMSALVSVHLLAVSFWFGALWPLRKAATAGSNIQAAGKLAHRFGKQAAFVVVSLIIAGLLLIYQVVGSLTAIFTTQYGLTLLVKTAIVAFLLFLAVANKTRFVPKMLKGDGQAASHLQHSIACELAAFIGVFLTTAILTTITPLPS